MNDFSAAILGLVQGLTEFIPVSSSGHLVIIPDLLHWESPGLAFDTVLHLGTLVALLAYFRQDMLAMFAAFLASLRDMTIGRMKWRTAMTSSQERRLVWLVLLGTLPAGLAGVLLKDYIGDLFESSAATACFMLLTGGMIWFVGRKTAADVSRNHPSPVIALAVGLTQALAILPGISRSGATISAGLMLGLDREAAPRFSFLLAIPAIIGASFIQVRELHQLANEQMAPLLLGFVVAAVSGYAAIHLVFRSLRSHKFHYFAYYCWSFGLLVLALRLTGRS